MNKLFCPWCYEHRDVDVCPECGAGCKQQHSLLSGDVSDSRAGEMLDDGRYRILCRVESGGVSNVYKAYDPIKAKLCALKILKKDAPFDIMWAKKHFVREAQAIARVFDPHIVGFEDYGITGDGRPYIIMDWLEGEDLAHHIASRGAMELIRTTGLALQICLGLKAIHNKGLVHRDMKPSNVFLTEGNGKECVKLVDFGLVARSTSEVSTSRINIVYGTRIYMAPEQFLRTDVDFKADLYALGAILFEMLSGKPAFAGSDEVTLARKKNEEFQTERRLHGAVPPALIDLISNLLHPNPQNRPESVEEVIDVLGGLHGELESVSATGDRGDQKKNEMREADLPTVNGKESDVSVFYRPGLSLVLAIMLSGAVGVAILWWIFKG